MDLNKAWPAMSRGWSDWTRPANFDRRSLILTAAVLVFLTAPLDIPQLVCAFIGALVYASLQAVPQIGRQPRGKVMEPPKVKGSSTARLPRKAADMTPKSRDFLASGPMQPQSGHSQLDCKRSSHSPSIAPPTFSASTVLPLAAALAKPTVMPIQAPMFEVRDFAGQVAELVERLKPTPASERAVEKLTQRARSAIAKLLPDAEVMGFAVGDVGSGTAYGVAVPEVDIVASVTPGELTARLQGRLAHNARPRNTHINKLDARKLHKSAIRVCTSMLVSVGFKFRRSSFRSQEPKVTLLAPASLGISSQAIPVDFSVNSTTPLYNMALMTECGQMEPRARDLILLVKRWAKDRGICHASKGHLPPYAWSLLTIYFLQVGVSDDGPLLPPLADFAFSSDLVQHEQDKSATRGKSQARQNIRNAAGGERGGISKPKKSVAQLFAEFIRFYSSEIDWRQEAASVRLGQRSTPDLSLGIHVVVSSNGSILVAPTIEDPFDTSENLGACANEQSLLRLAEELARAKCLLEQGVSLTELLEPWRPPEHTQDQQDDGDEDAEEPITLGA